jgi:uncharacterized protein YkwD
LRKVLAVVLGVPVVAFVYLASAARRPTAGRAVLALAAGASLGIGIVALVPPRPTAATPPTPILPLPTAAFKTPLTVGLNLHTPVTIDFSAPMDAASVAAALRVEPSTAVQLLWDPAGRALTIQPVDMWAPGLLHTITVDQGALDLAGQPLTTPARSVFVTRSIVTGALSASDMAGDRLALDSAFDLAFDAPVDMASAVAAFRIEPAVPGQLVPVGRRSGVTSLRFVPERPLAPDTAYRVWFADGLVDLDGIGVRAGPQLRARTVAAPQVVRFRPRAKTHGVERGTNVSVRFTQPMSRVATAAAFHVIVYGREVNGRISWAEHDTVLVFDPAKPLPYGSTVVMRVDATARSKTKVAAVAAAALFRVKDQPAAPKRVRPRPHPAKPIPKPGGTIGRGAWGAVEAYYLRLMNCTRTGGWVTSSGACSSPGGRSVAPLRLDAGISARVSRPYAKLLATRGICNHFINGNPGDRLRRAGYSSYRWAENLGCRSGNPYSAVLGSHLFFQSERAWSPDGGHYVNLMNPMYDRVGIGVWVSAGRVRVVIDFYHP